MDCNAYIYLSVILEFESSPPDIEERMFEVIVSLALKQLHGDVGVAILVDLVMYDPENIQGILKVRQSDLVKLWSALTLYGCFEDQRCAFIVRKESTDFIPLLDTSKHSISELGGCG
ncbi:ribonuclease P protein subunit p14-like [Lytechinus variegatus]|uniref:ribonuclease P protein subunit p14-like n=1 Tax=Lytechinus variegatus TaxID=7654 RepID=UPI001BB2D070|nr:ribonuclease P protein subunit p14-like [Lytechinus variegatus]